MIDLRVVLTAAGAHAHTETTVEQLQSVHVAAARARQLDVVRAIYEHAVVAVTVNRRLAVAVSESHHCRIGAHEILQNHCASVVIIRREANRRTGRQPQDVVVKRVPRGGRHQHVVACRTRHRRLHQHGGAQHRYSRHQHKGQ